MATEQEIQISNSTTILNIHHFLVAKLNKKVNKTGIYG